MKQQFIRTSDCQVAEELRKNGFAELAKQGSFYVFINNGKINFSDEEKKKVVYSNLMTV